MTTPSSGRKRGKPTNGTPSSGSKKSKETEVCLICDEIIHDGDNPDDAVYCEGDCQGWLHRNCVCMTKKMYVAIGQSNDPYFCPHCKFTIYHKEINSLRDTIQALSKELSHLKSQNPSAKPPVNVSPEHAASTEQDSARKFNVVLFGLNECSKGTKKIEREKSDLINATKVVTDLDSSIQSHSIRDTIRLGKYNPSGRPRPLLVSLNRSSDVNIILSKRAQVKSPYVIKPDLPRDARVTESHLLKVRWSLIQANTPKSDIKIRGNKIYVKGKLHGLADSTGFRLNEPPSDRNTSSLNTMDTSTAAATHPSI